MEWWQIQELMWTSTGIFATVVVVSGLTLRFAIKPFLRDFARLRGGQKDEAQAVSELRLERLEEQLEVLGSSVERIADAVEFDRKLNTGDAPSEGVPKG